HAELHAHVEDEVQFLFKGRHHIFSRIRCVNFTATRPFSTPTVPRNSGLLEKRTRVRSIKSRGMASTSPTLRLRISLTVMSFTGQSATIGTGIFSYGARHCILRPRDSSPCVRTCCNFLTMDSIIENGTP